MTEDELTISEAEMARINQEKLSKDPKAKVYTLDQIGKLAEKAVPVHRDLQDAFQELRESETQLLATILDRVGMIKDFSWYASRVPMFGMTAVVESIRDAAGQEHRERLDTLLVILKGKQ